MEESRREIKQRVNALLKTAAVSPKAMTALYLALRTTLRVIGNMVGDGGFLRVFFSLLTELLAVVLDAGFTLYCMAVLRGERAEYLTLFDGFDSALKIALLEIVRSTLIILWYVFFLLAGSTLVALLSVAVPAALDLLFPVVVLSLVPLLVVCYRYSFALFNLLENQDIGILEAIRMSKRQTRGWKMRLLGLDLSYTLWYLLEILPGLLYNVAITWQVHDKLDGVTYTADSFLEQIWNTLGAMNGSAFGIPASIWLVITAVWTLAVAIFWRPNIRCAKLVYFDAAKRASGIGEDAAPWDREEFYQR